MNGQKFSEEKVILSCKHGTQDVCMVNKVCKYHCMCKAVTCVYVAIEKQHRIFF
jgi:hypothetical protein